VETRFWKKKKKKEEDPREDTETLAVEVTGVDDVRDPSSKS